MINSERLHKFEPSIEKIEKGKNEEVEEGNEEVEQEEKNERTSVHAQADTVCQALQQDAPTVPLVLGPAPTEEQMEMLDKIVVPVDQVDPDDSGSYVDLGSGFKIRVKRNSGYSSVYVVAARECHLPETHQKLKDGPAPKNETEAKAMMDQMFVPRKRMIEAIQNDPTWIAYRQRKTDRLKMKAGAGDTKASAILAKQTEESVVMEMLSLLAGSGSPNANSRNLRPLTNAGLLMRRFPLQCRRGQNHNNVYVTIHAIEHEEAVRDMIKMATGVDEREILDRMKKGKADKDGEVEQ